MDTPTASRSSRPPLRTALIAVVAMLGLAACSSSESTSTENGSGSDSEAAATNDMATNDVATNDVATSTEVDLTLEFDQESLEELLSTGSQVVVMREVQASDGGVTQLTWLSLNPFENNRITYDPVDLQVFASATQLVPGVAIEEFVDADISPGGTATWDGEQFEVLPGPGDTITVMAGAEGPPLATLGLAGSATVNGSETSAPYVAGAVLMNEMVQFTDTGRIVVWVSSDPAQPGAVVGPMPSNATTIDTASQPNATLRFDQESGTFELVS